VVAAVETEAVVNLSMTFEHCSLATIILVLVGVVVPCFASYPSNLDLASSDYLTMCFVLIVISLITNYFELQVLIEKCSSVLTD